MFLFGALTILGHAAIIHGGDVPPWDWWSLVLVGSWSWAVSIAMKFMPDEGEEEGNGG